MQPEREMKILPIDENLLKTIENLLSEGWKITPGVTPVAVYHLSREKMTDTVSAVEIKAKLTIDETKIGIVRDNKYIAADGTVTPIADMPKSEQ